MNEKKKEFFVNDYSYIELYVKYQFLLYSNAKNENTIAICDPQDLKSLPSELAELPHRIITKQTLYHVLEEHFANLNIIKSKYWLDFISNKDSAKNINFIKYITCFLLIFYLIITKSAVVFHVVHNVSHFIQHIVKIVIAKSNIRSNLQRKDAIDLENTDETQLPIYSVLIPLYKEINQIRDIIITIHNLEYPKDKLDVKLIIEADDYELQNFFENYEIPNYIHIIIVPEFLPRTKPKALNYAMQYVRGEYLVIYDAEDRPQADQLLKAIATFRMLPDEYACVQAKLCIHNSSNNLLTEFFAIEYNVWFNIFLQGLSIINSPIPLGGTSNHFKTEILRSLGGWDAYNVTEDAELGIRLYINHYKTYIIDSFTFEEAPTKIHDWLKQRTRWMKGFIQSLIMFNRISNKHKILSKKQLLITYTLLGLPFYNFFTVPWVVFMLINNNNSYISWLWAINSLLALTYTYVTMFYTTSYIHKKLQYTKQHKIYHYFVLLFYPLYSLLHIIASYLALFELLTNPFKWNKTPHGNNLS